MHILKLTSNLHQKNYIKFSASHLHVDCKAFKIRYHQFFITKYDREMRFEDITLFLWGINHVDG